MLKPTEGAVGVVADVILQVAGTTEGGGSTAQLIAHVLAHLSDGNFVRSVIAELATINPSGLGPLKIAEPWTPESWTRRDGNQNLVKPIVRRIAGHHDRLNSTAIRINEITGWLAGNSESPEYEIDSFVDVFGHVGNVVGQETYGSLEEAIRVADAYLQSTGWILIGPSAPPEDL